MKITVEKLSPEEQKRRGIPSWPIWECEVSRFDWHYEQTEECLLIKGEVVVETSEGTTHIKAGDYVTFPQDLSCVWDVKQPVKKHYTFR